MARSDLLIALVKAGTSGDKRAARTTAEAIIAEERAKQHVVLAERLTEAIYTNGSSAIGSLDGLMKGRDLVAEIVPRRHLDDLMLPGVVREAVDQLVEEQCRADVLRSHGVEPRHRILLVGPPGTGKTSLAEAIAEAIGSMFLVVRYEAIIGSYLGETAARLKRVFEVARTTPCVLFFDEFDAIAKERGDTHETGEIKRVVSSLLMQIDELPSYAVVVAATNHAELLDRGAWRRFQLRLALPMPTQKVIARYIDAFAPNYHEPLGYTGTSLAKRLGRISFAEVEQFCLDLRRRQILALGTKPLKYIVDDQLGIWSAQAKAASIDEGEADASASATNPSHT